VCADERQWLPPGGQRWTTLAELTAAGHACDVRAVEPGLTGLGADPPFAIGQRSLLVRREHRLGKTLAQGPGVGSGFPAKLVDPRRHARSRRRLDPPELKLGPHPLTPGRPLAPFPGGPGGSPPLPVDDPVLEDRAHGVQPASPHEPGGPAVFPGPDADRLAVHLAHQASRLVSVPASAMIEYKFIRTRMQIIFASSSIRLADRLRRGPKAAEGYGSRGSRPSQPGMG